MHSCNQKYTHSPLRIIEPEGQPLCKLVDFFLLHENKLMPKCIFKIYKEEYNILLFQLATVVNCFSCVYKSLFPA